MCVGVVAGTLSVHTSTHIGSPKLLNLLGNSRPEKKKEHPPPCAVSSTDGVFWAVSGVGGILLAVSINSVGGTLLAVSSVAGTFLAVSSVAGTFLAVSRVDGIYLPVDGNSESDGNLLPVYGIVNLDGFVFGGDAIRRLYADGRRYLFSRRYCPWR